MTTNKQLLDDDDTDSSIFCADFVGIKCPECGMMLLKRTKIGEEHCINKFCSYDKRTNKKDNKIIAP